MSRHWRALGTALATAAMALLASAAPASGASTGLAVTARFALLANDTSVVLVGQYSCGPFDTGVPDRGVIDMSIRQTVGGTDVVGSGFLTPTVCDGLPQWYAAELTTFAGTFRPGNALWSASGYVEGSTGLQNVFVPPTRIRIR